MSHALHHLRPPPGEDEKEAPTAFFLSSAGGRVFVVHYHPPVSADRGRDLVFVPPFAEEMNLSRHTVARQSRAFCQRGCGVLVLDLFGTGDSYGGFEEATWPIWQENVRSAVAWLRDHGRARVGLWGLRLGALLAAELAAPLDADPLVLWQPVDGPAMLNGFLRIGGVSTMKHGDSLGTASKKLKDALSRGESVEVAGYRLSSELAMAMAERDLLSALTAYKGTVHWLEIRGRQEAGALPPRALTAWRERGIRIDAASAIDRAFWAIKSHDPIWANELIRVTIECVVGRGART